MANRLASLLALALAGGLLWWAAGRDRDRTEPRPERPERAASQDDEEPPGVVWRMLDASRDGDVAAYLDCFADPLAERLRSLAEQMGEGGFATYLRDSMAELKGVAVYDVVEEADRATVVVEYVFATETERQTFVLERSGSSVWRIAEAENAIRRRSPVPYAEPAVSATVAN